VAATKKPERQKNVQETDTKAGSERKTWRKDGQLKGSDRQGKMLRNERAVCGGGGDRRAKGGRDS